MAVPVRSELRTQVLDDERRLIAGISRLMDERRNYIEGLARGLPRPTVMLEGAMQSLDLQRSGLVILRSEKLKGAKRGSRSQCKVATPKGGMTKAEAELTARIEKVSIAIRAFVRERTSSFVSLSAAERLEP